MNHLFNLSTLSLCLMCLVAQAQTGIGSKVNPTGNPIGGGSGYSSNIEAVRTSDFSRNNNNNADFVVTTKSQLLSALQQADPGDVIYINQSASINMSGNHETDIPEGVTVCGNRGTNGSAGPLIYTTQKTKNYIFNLRDNSRLSGVRIRGADVKYSQITYPISPFPPSPNQQSSSKAIALRGDNVELDNCEIYQFHRVGIDCQGGFGHHVHHNYIHDIHAYPILVPDLAILPLIEANTMEYIWHAVAGTGNPGNGFIVRYNDIILRPIPHSWYSQGSHAIDMHPSDDIESMTGVLVAGDKMEVYNNSFIDQSGSHPSISIVEDAKIRGVPRLLARFYNNEFMNADPAESIEWEEEPGNTFSYNNSYGGGSVVPIAMETTPQILYNSPPALDVDLTTFKTESIALDVVVGVFNGLSLSSVVIKIDGTTYFSGSSAPTPGSLSVDVDDLSGSTHEIEVIATDNRGVQAFHKSVFKTQNGSIPDCQSSTLNTQSLNMVDGQYRSKTKINAKNTDLSGLSLVYFTAPVVELGQNFEVDAGTTFQINPVNGCP